MESKTVIRAYRCAVKGGVTKTKWESVINAPCPTKAKSWFHAQIRDVWPVSFIDITCKCIGVPQSTEMFQHVAEQRRFKFNVGDRVTDISVNNASGYIVDANGSSNILIYFDSGPNAGIRLAVHPYDIQAAI